MRCRSFGLVLVVMAALAGAGAAVAAGPGSGAAGAVRPIRSGHYSGKTRQHRPISLDISVTGKRVVHPILYLVTRCPGTSKRSYAATSSHATATASGLIRHGKFSFHFTERSQVPNGGMATARFLVRGRFISRTRARGRVSVTVTYAGPPSLVCTSGKVKFHVHS